VAESPREQSCQANNLVSFCAPAPFRELKPTFRRGTVEYWQRMEIGSRAADGSGEGSSEQETRDMTKSFQNID